MQLVKKAGAGSRAGMKARGAAEAGARRGDSAQRVYEAVRSKILSLQMAPGVAIDEAALVREFGVSRTPVREAVVRLASDGLVNLFPNRGSQVAPLDLDRIRDYLEAIDLCQRAVTNWAALRCRPQDVAKMRARAAEFERAAESGDTDAMVLSNRSFHLSIADACGNAQIAAAYARILDEGLRISRFTLSTTYYPQGPSYGQFVEQIVREHREMVDAIERHDTQAAEKLAADHTENTRDRFIGFLGDSLSPGIAVGQPRSR